jgi:predicted permease
MEANMRKMLSAVAGVLLLAGAAFAMKSSPTDVAQATPAMPSAFGLMSIAKDLPVAPAADAI